MRKQWSQHLQHQIKVMMSNNTVCKLSKSGIEIRCTTKLLYANSFRFTVHTKHGEKWTICSLCHFAKFFFEKKEFFSSENYCCAWHKTVQNKIIQIVLGQLCRNSPEWLAIFPKKSAADTETGDQKSQAIIANARQFIRTILDLSCRALH